MVAICKARDPVLRADLCPFPTIFLWKRLTGTLHETCDTCLPLTPDRCAEDR